jgi:CheY-like chemotaxis protein
MARVLPVRLGQGWGVGVSDKGKTVSRNFERVKVVVCAAKASLDPIKKALAKLGVRDVLWCDDVPSMLRLLEEGLVDVLIGDYSFLGSNFVTAAQNIRHKIRGRNPFLILIAMAEIPSRETLRLLLDAGIDDFLRSPISPERMVAGLNGFTLDRRNFVASFDYVGPTRRSTDRDHVDPSSLIEVPNTLLSKVVLNIGDAELQRTIDAAQVALEDRQSDTRATQIVDLSRQICAKMNDGEEQQAMALIDQLQSLAKNFLARCGENVNPQIANFLKLLQILLIRLRQKQGHSEADLQLLENLSLAVKRALTVESEQVSLMVEIIETVARHKTTH